MAKFDRYMLSQLLLFFGFFALVLVAVFWISRSVPLFDQLIADGQSVFVFLEFTALGLPRIVLLVLPIATFAASVYVTNRFTNESELTVMRATGSSPWRMARPVFFFGVFIAFMVAILSHVLVPIANDRLEMREAEVNKDTTARLLTEGTFVHPSEGVTLYTREIGDDGVLNGVFLSDRRDANERVIYTANQAYLLRQNGRASLIMIDGLAQRYAPSTRKLAVGTFTDFSYDITALLSGDEGAVRKVRAIPTPSLYSDWTDLAVQTQQSIGTIAEEFHSRFAEPVFVLAAALFGFSALLTSGFSRFGIWREVVVAFAILIFLDSLRGALSDRIQGNAGLWPLAYVHAVLCLALVAITLKIASRPLRFPKLGRA